MVSPHGYHTSGVTSLFEPNFISKLTILYEDYFPLLITFYMIYIYFIDISKCKQVNIVLLCVNIHMYHIRSNFKGLLHILCIQSLLL